MPYFSISQKYRSPGGLDPSLRQFLDGLPLGTIRASVHSGVQSIASSASYSFINFNAIDEDTGKFLPLLMPQPGFTIPKDAGGLYVYSLFGVWNTGAFAAPPANSALKVSFQLTYPDEIQAFALGDCRIFGFQYMVPGDVIFGAVRQVSGAAVNFGGATLKIARVTV
jgi:hypothetical protein